MVLLKCSIRWVSSILFGSGAYGGFGSHPFDYTFTIFYCPLHQCATYRYVQYISDVLPDPIVEILRKGGLIELMFRASKQLLIQPVPCVI